MKCRYCAQESIYSVCDTCSARRHKLALYLRARENLTYREIGARLGVTTERARQMTHKELRRIRRLDRAEVDPQILELSDRYKEIEDRNAEDAGIFPYRQTMR